MATAGDAVKQWVHDLLDRKNRRHIFKVLLIGDSVGKSSLVLRFCADEFEDFEESAMQTIPMTLGLDVKSRVLEFEGPDGNDDVCLNLWDTAGQNRFRQMNEQYLPTADAVILLYDVRNVQTLKDCRRFVDDVQRFCHISVVKILVGNKDDFDESRKAVSSTHGADLARAVGYHFIETSAKDDRNVHQLFRKVGQLCLERERQRRTEESSKG